MKAARTGGDPGADPELSAAAKKLHNRREEINAIYAKAGR